MKKYEKLILLSSILFVLIAAIIVVMMVDVNFGFFNNLSIESMKQKRTDADLLIAQETIEETNNETAKTKLQTAKNNFDVAKEKYESIDPSTIEIVQEATKQEDYFIEYLWIVLGNYATSNNVAIDIITPGSTHVSQTEDATTNNSASTNSSGANTNSSNVTALTDGIKIIVEGRYANLADFVFDVENDKELSFKLDNIVMGYTRNNRVQATFDVLRLSVVK